MTFAFITPLGELIESIAALMYNPLVSPDVLVAPARCIWVGVRKRSCHRIVRFGIRALGQRVIEL